MTGAPKANRGPSAGPENRQALITAAREVFATEGYSFPLSAVAKKAGVGQGSLYRHFPDRTSLAVAVFDENFVELEATVADPDAGLDALLHRIIDQAVASGAFIDMIQADRDDARVAHFETRLRDLAEVVVTRERTAGRLAATVQTADVILAVSLLASLLARTPPAQRADVAERAWRLFAAAFHP